MSNTKGQQQANYAPEDKAISKTADNYQELIHKCPKCGAIHSSTDRFCSEWGFGLKSKSCEQCGAAVEPDMELCPKCKVYYKGIQYPTCIQCLPEDKRKSALEMIEFGKKWQSMERELGIDWQQKMVSIKNFLE